MIVSVTAVPQFMIVRDEKLLPTFMALCPSMHAHTCQSVDRQARTVLLLAAA